MSHYPPGSNGDVNDPAPWHLAEETPLFVTECFDCGEDIPRSQYFDLCRPCELEHRRDCADVEGSGLSEEQLARGYGHDQRT